MIKDSIIYFFSKFFPSIISIVTMFLFLKLMDSEDYGIYSIVIISIGLVNIITSQWLRSSMIRYFFNIPGILNTIITIQIGIITLLGILNIITLIYFEVRMSMIIITTMLIVNIIVFEFLNNYYRTIIKPKIVLFGNLIRNFIFFIILIIIIYYKNDISILDAIISFTIGLIVSNFYLLYFFNYKTLLVIDKSHLKKISIYGIPLTLSFALGVFLQNIDKYMITYLLDIKSNGNYSLIYDFVHNSLYMIIGALGMASLPRILKQSKSLINTKEFEKYIEVLYIISIPLTFSFISVSSELALIINSYGYQTSSYIIILITIATFIHGTNTFVYGQAVQLMQNTKIIYVPSLIAIIVNIILNILLLPNFGISGAAISILLAFICSNIFIYNFSLKKSGINYYPKIFYKSVLVGLISLTIVNFIEFNNLFITVFVKGIISICLQIFVIIKLYFKEKR
ncbi:UNVERIFIED_CONTAM: oligosaccharide flippase family protein [Mammaliicoccus sciuri]